MPFSAGAVDFKFTIYCAIAGAFCQSLLIFFSGRRVCIGESLARMELFQFFTSLLQRFHFSPPPGVSKDDLDLKPVVGFTLNPVPHKLCAVKRT